MDPKEKAAYLVLKYMSKLVDRQLAKQCALVAVDEIIKEYGTYYKIELDGKYISFWEQVKEEINKV